MSVDVRAFSRTKLIPPNPLPFVSRRALAKVINALPIPEVCHLCEGRIRLVNNSEVYNGRSYGDWPYVYACYACGSYVSLHPKTDLPTGLVADAFTREARRAAKAPFFTVTRAFFGNNRNKAYEWLATEMRLTREECHFAVFDEEQCARVFEICINKLF